MMGVSLHKLGKCINQMIVFRIVVVVIHLVPQTKVSRGGHLLFFNFRCMGEFMICPIQLSGSKGTGP